MKTFVINLKRRSDRKEKFIAQNHHKLNGDYEFFTAYDGKTMTYQDMLDMGYDSDKNWLDETVQFSGRTYLSHASYCNTISQMTLWKKCIELNEPVFILEDDARILDNFNIQEIYDLLDAGYNLIYPGYSEKKQSEVIQRGSYQIPVLPYWASSYVITPVSAQVLTSEYNQKHLIYPDELLAKAVRESPIINPIGRIENSIDQGEHSKDPYLKKHDSDVNPYENQNNGIYDMLIDFKVHHIHDKIRESIDILPDSDLILYTSNKCFVPDTVNQIMYRYMRTGRLILVGGKKECSNELNELFDSNERYKYPNCNMFIGRVDELKKVFSNDKDDLDLLFTVKYLTGKYDMIVDSNCDVFQSEEDSIEVMNTQWGKELWNPITQTQPCVYHDDNDIRRNDLRAKLNTSSLKYSFKNFMPNGIGADVSKICILKYYCKLKNISLYMNENDEWRIAHGGNWRTLFDSMIMSKEDIPEVTKRQWEDAISYMPISFDKMVECVNEIYVPNDKYKVDHALDNKYAVVHVRRGDKVKGKWREGTYHELDEYLYHLKDKYDNKDIFVMTDSPDVAEEAKSKGCMIDESEERRDGYVYNLYHKNEYTENDMEDELNIFFKNMEIFKHASDLVGSNASCYYVLGQLLNGKQGVSLSDNLNYQNIINSQ